ncbi:MAG TPA: dihydroneopterin aldolase [Candidatus Limnocylindrales bacterium]|nr:dihydroneopterin aldolase [Candidatus Limnocylindrales bacterium]
MTDRVVLANMAFQARHGVNDWEKVEAQRFEVDVELLFDVQPAGIDDDLSKTIDYRAVYSTTRQIVESTTFNLIEALAEAIAHELLLEHALVREVVVRVRKPEVQLDGPLAYSGVEIRRTRGRGGS